jgi:geranylgeranyl diphosphate synthase type I
MVLTSTDSLREISTTTDTLIRDSIEEAISAMRGRDSLLSEMVRYHLGLDDESPGMSETVRQASRGKRLRPALALLCCQAVGGTAESAAPLAAAIELLHNFTLIHDDIQDQSSHRRHRPTVWHRWGAAQAINAGDALFAAAHLPLFQLPDAGVSTDLTLRLVQAFDRTTIEIVQGQVSDLSFEGTSTVDAKHYLRMIAGKTAAIVRYAAWAGALVGGASEETADRFATFGQALGMGFQIRDDFLGIWGASSATGKTEADDIRRRKQSLPILLLREAADAQVRAELDAMYAMPDVDRGGVERVLSLLAMAGIRERIEQDIRTLHDTARQSLIAATSSGSGEARNALLSLTDALSSREG